MRNKLHRFWAKTKNLDKLERFVGNNFFLDKVELFGGNVSWMNTISYFLCLWVGNGPFINDVTQI